MLAEAGTYACELFPSSSSSSFSFLASPPITPSSSQCQQQPGVRECGAKNYQSPRVLGIKTYNAGENKSSNQGLSLNRSQCGGCSTEYNTLASN